MKKLILTFLLIFISTHTFAITKISRYIDRQEVVFRIYKKVDNYTFVKIIVRDMKTKKVKQRSFNFYKNYQIQKTDEFSCLGSSLQSLILDEKSLSSFSKFLDFNDQFFKTKYGLLVEKACLKKESKEFIETNLAKSMERGIKCLSSLNTKNSKNLLQKINTIFDDKNSTPKIFCSETEFEVMRKGLKWDSAKAYASASSDMSKGKMQHPFISVSPKWNWRFNSYGMQSTVFHELLHNTGSIHTETIEYPYSCQECCFSQLDNTNLQMNPSSFASDVKASACKICKSTYAGITDKNYIKDYVEFRLHGSNSLEVFNTLKNYMKERPGDNFALKQLIYFQSKREGELGKELEVILRYGPKDNLGSGLGASGNLAYAIYYYAKGDMKKSSDYINLLSSRPLLFSDYSYAKIFKSVKRDLFFSSFSDSAFSISPSNENRSISDLFKKATKTLDFSL